MQRFSRYFVGATGVLMMALVVLLLSLPTNAVTLAQAAPTATPNDPIWRGFAASRDAIQEARNVDLTLVSKWEFEESDWNTSGGIDGCVDLVDITAYRPIYFGWTYTLTSMRGQVFQTRVSFDLTEIAVCDKISTEAAPAPVAGATIDPNLPPPVAGSAAIGGFELGGQVLDMSLNTFGLMNRAGMKWVKQQVHYAPGENGSKVAGQVNVAHSNGFKILLSIKGEKADLGANFDGYLAGYAGFLGQAAAAGADAIEVWNEPNIDREWPAGQVNGGTYTKMLASAFNAIKSSNANTIVISAAPAPTGFFGTAGCTAQGCNDDTFMTQMAQAGAANYMDCVGLHYNEGVIPPGQASGDPRGGYPTYYFGSMLARGYNPFGGKPVCFTELGYLSPEGYSQPLPANFAWGQNTTAAQQATWLAQAATLSAQSGHVRMMIVFNVDFPYYTADDPQGGYAMLRPGGGCPSCDALGGVMKK
ncbi:MAG: hypothetical protein LCI00_05230 [Chloroflexi bacterium]|nr:hypothetical protein [Chloroflexota bacterium]MCC6896454.1 hypothetical protein [Anaerolineae bacterium]